MWNSLIEISEVRQWEELEKIPGYQVPNFDTVYLEESNDLLQSYSSL